MAQGVAAGGFNRDHLGAEVGEQLAGLGQHGAVAELCHADAGQGGALRGAHGRFLPFDVKAGAPPLDPAGASPQAPYE